ncbi:MAG: hypothetical protein JXA33_09245 [Anaerolineae bacterium]|nr:hypothetical protein [Anaerolineae bacterium]
MPPLNTHLVIGERVFPQISTLDRDTYGDFLLGCLIVDVNSFTDIDRSVTHFVGRVNEDGAAAYTQSCTNFLAQLDDLLQVPWDALPPSSRAFVAGYLCHLAADEPWKAWGTTILRALQLNTMRDLPVPGEVILTTFSVLSHAFYHDFAAVSAAMERATLPDVFTHVPHHALQKMWNIFRRVLPYEDTVESYFAMLEGIGLPATEIARSRAVHAQYWDQTVALIEKFRGAQDFIDHAVSHSLKVLAYLELKYP